MTGEDKRVVLVAAVADNGVIGQGGGVPWHIAEDMRHFRETTLGNVVVMGRRTYESIGRALPGRTNIVLTRDPGWAADGVLVAHDVDGAVKIALDHDGEVMVIGGARVYAEAMDRADAQVITEVHLAPEGDTFYPPFDPGQWTQVRREARGGHDFVWWERRGRTDSRGSLGR